MRSSSLRTNILRYLRAPRAVSSVGSEHLVYTEGVGGSSPSPPTHKGPCDAGLFVASTCNQSLLREGRSRRWGPTWNAGRCIAQHIAHHKQSATHPNHVLNRTMRQGAIQCIHGEPMTSPCNSGLTRATSVGAMARGMSLAHHQQRCRLGKQGHAPGPCPRPLPRRCEAPLPVGWTLARSSCDRFGDAIEVVGAIQHHKRTVEKLNTLPTAKLTCQRGVVFQAMRQGVIRPPPAICFNT